MDDQRYDIYFTGKLIDGVPEAQAQQNLASLFKTSVDKVARLFNGKPQLLKRGMDKSASVKYKAAFESAGLVVAFKKLPAAAAAPEEPTPAKQASAPQADMTLAPVGSDVLRDDERREIAEVDIDTSNIKLVSAFMEPEPEEKPAIAAPDTSHLSVAELGADILAEKPPQATLPELDIDAITLAEVGSDLEQLHEDLPLVDPDISDITLAEVGADVLPDKPPAPAAVVPDISHLKIADDDTSGG